MFWPQAIYLPLISLACTMLLRLALDTKFSWEASNVIRRISAIRLIL